MQPAYISNWHTPGAVHAREHLSDDVRLIHQQAGLHCKASDMVNIHYMECHNPKCIIWHFMVFFQERHLEHITGVSVARCAEPNRCLQQDLSPISACCICFVSRMYGIPRAGWLHWRGNMICQFSFTSVSLGIPAKLGGSFGIGHLTKVWNVPHIDIGPYAWGWISAGMGTWSYVSAVSGPW